MFYNFISDIGVFIVSMFSFIITASLFLIVVAFSIFVAVLTIKILIRIPKLLDSLILFINNKNARFNFRANRQTNYSDGFKNNSENSIDDYIISDYILSKEDISKEDMSFLIKTYGEDTAQSKINAKAKSSN